MKKGVVGVVLATEVAVVYDTAVVVSSAFVVDATTVIVVAVDDASVGGGTRW